MEDKWKVVNSGIKKNHDEMHKKFFCLQPLILSSGF